MDSQPLRISSLEFSQNPYRYYSELRKNGRFHPIVEPEGILVTGFEECKQILNNPDAFSSSVNSFIDPVLLGADPPEHTRNKSILQSNSGLFTHGRIANLQPRVEEICDRLIDKINAQESFDLVAQLAFPLSSLVTLDLLGIEVENNTELEEWTKNAVSNKSIHNKDFAQAQWETLKPQIAGWIENSKKQQGNSGLSEIISHQTADQELTNDEVLSLIKILLIGGNETTPNLISSAVFHLMCDLKLMEEVRNDQSLIPALVRETLRFEAPTQMVNRICKRDINISGLEIMKGTFVALGIAAANRDPSAFDAPEKFNIHRDEKQHLSFGFGPHYCIGSHLANLEAIVAIKKLLNSFGELHLPAAFSPVYRNSSHVRGLTHLPLQTNTKEGLRNPQKRKKEALDLIRSETSKYGEIPTYQNFPNFEQKKHKGWHYTFPSPFIHANVLYSLLNSGDEEAVELAQEKVAFLLDTKEEGSVWRFWRLENCEDPVPPDIDDTAICSLVLEKLGHEQNNKNLLEKNIKADGRFLTWIFPKLSMLLNHPKLYFKLRRMHKRILPTLQSGMLHPDDHEIGVSANALMYLGENGRTKIAIKKCIEDWKNESDAFNFYGEKLVVAYHVARAYHEGIRGFGELKENTAQMIEKEVDDYKFAQLLIAFLSLNYFGLNNHLTDYIERRIKNHCLLHAEIFENYPYFTSKDRVFLAGSPCLTASWFLEASKYFDLS